MSQNYRVLRGFDVRVKPGENNFRRVAEPGDIITAADCPEWGGEAPASEIEAGVVELIAEDQVKTVILPNLTKHHAGGTLDEGGDEK